jgi:hypothetical protein
LLSGSQEKQKLRARKWFHLLIGEKCKLGRVIERGNRRNGLKLQTEKWLRVCPMMTTERGRGEHRTKEKIGGKNAKWLLECTEKEDTDKQIIDLHQNLNSNKQILHRKLRIFLSH